jgi:hypothetical protein
LFCSLRNHLQGKPLRGRSKSSANTSTEKALGGEIASLLAGKNIFITPTASPNTSQQNIKVPEESLSRSDSQQSVSGTETPKSTEDSKNSSLASSTNDTPAANQEGTHYKRSLMFCPDVQLARQNHLITPLLV